MRFHTKLTLFISHVYLGANRSVYGEAEQESPDFIVQHLCSLNKHSAANCRYLHALARLLPLGFYFPVVSCEDGEVVRINIAVTIKVTFWVTRWAGFVGSSEYVQIVNVNIAITVNIAWKLPVDQYSCRTCVCDVQG